MPRILIGNVKGPQGEKGDTGATGAPGEAASIRVGAVETVAYGQPAAVTNTGTDYDAVFNFRIPQGAPGQAPSGMGNLLLDSMTESTAEYPVIAVDERGATIFGKIKKFLNDLRTNGLFKSNLVNGFTQTTPGVNALDAAAGKTLNDSLANYATKTELTNSTFQRIAVPSDLNSMTTLWQYTDFPFAKTPSNAPYGAGTVYTLGGMSNVQVMFPYDFTQGTKFVFFRTRYANTWGAWYKVAVTAV